MEDAAAQLLHQAFLEIRFRTSATRDDQSAEAAAQRRERANEIADICHNLPLRLDPNRRVDLADGLRYQWETASARKRRWLQSRWDQIGLDHRLLTDPRPEPPSPAGDDRQPLSPTQP